MRLAKCFMFLFSLILLSTFAVAQIGYDNPYLPKLIAPKVTTGSSINYSTANVNNSLYWQGHTGTDGSWLTGLLNSASANATYLKLDQSTPQTIINGAPRFNEGINVSTGKKISDATLSDSYLLLNDGSGISYLSSYGDLTLKSAYGNVYLTASGTGIIHTDIPFVSVVATGTSPLSVLSTTLNTNLNADLLDGLHYTSLCLSNGTGCASSTLSDNSTQLSWKNITDWTSAPIYNSTYAGLINNDSYLSTFNSTYNSKADYEFGNNNFNGSGNFTTTGSIKTKYLNSTNITADCTLNVNSAVGTLCGDIAGKNIYAGTFKFSQMSQETMLSAAKTMEYTSGTAAAIAGQISAYDTSGTTTVDYYGLYFETGTSGSMGATGMDLFGSYSGILLRAGTGSTGTVSRARGVTASISQTAGSGTNITTDYTAFYVDNNVMAVNTKIANAYGLYIEDMGILGNVPAGHLYSVRIAGDGKNNSLSFGLDDDVNVFYNETNNSLQVTKSLRVDGDVLYDGALISYSPTILCSATEDSCMAIDYVTKTQVWCSKSTAKCDNGFVELSYEKLTNFVKCVAKGGEDCIETTSKERIETKMEAIKQKAEKESADNIIRQERINEYNQYSNNCIAQKETTVNFDEWKTLKIAGKPIPCEIPPK